MGRWMHAFDIAIPIEVGIREVVAKPWKKKTGPVAMKFRLGPPCLTAGV